ncbi:MAG: Na/Pi cotransporter family protein [Treponema sp.]|jgi:phosphate:Na+ symporter|nr:Na/Pi cotransporter family protein [Treponema sp.]
MTVISLLLRMTGGLCLFLFGMKVMSDGIQQSAGDRMKKALNFMTGNRFVGVLTGFVVTSVIQSSSATTVMVVAFVNAGLLTLTQSIGVIMGANIGTTVTAWIVSLLGFSINISNMALPAIGVGFILSVIKWKYKSLGDLLLGFGFLFMGLEYLTQTMSSAGDYYNFNALATLSHLGFLSTVIGAGAGLVITLLIHSSSASTAIVLTMAYNGVVGYEMAAGMILGANIGTTIDAALAAIGAKTAAKRTALVHVLFNVVGTLWALPLLKPLLALVHILTPGNPLAYDPAITMHLAMLHTVFNVTNTIAFLPFVNLYAKLVSLIIREDTSKEEGGHYKFTYITSAITDTPELNILRAEKEIYDMAGVASSMYARFSAVLRSLRETGDKNDAVTRLCEELKQKEEYADEMRESLSSFLIECSHEQINPRSEYRVSRLLRVIGYIEEMSDECYSISRLLEKSVRKDYTFKNEEMDDLIPYVNQIEGFLGMLKEQSMHGSKIVSAVHTVKLKADISSSRKKLQKLGRKRIEAGENVKTELMFIDLVRRIERLGDYCFDIAEVIAV